MKKRISVASAKDKGRRLQNWTCEQISKFIKMPWGKDEHVAPREMGQSGTDVRLVGKARKRFPFSVECKYQESWSIHQWIKQARDNKEKKMDWLLICRRNRMDPIVVMDAKAFFRMLRKLRRKERRKWR